MATLTRAQVVALALEAVGVKPFGVAASAEDQSFGERAYDSVYGQLRKRGLVPFDDEAVPEYAWGPLTDLTAADVAPRFGITGARLQEWLLVARRGREEMERQTAGYKHPIAIRADYY